ncbi:tetratricopeptide repeat-containing protein [Chloroflexus sp.]|uniref:tetratricopeptide repeat-containing protein n=1 Tax=Chloroflexus sp. TaxID=1904827 RepID=UPI003C72F265
MDNEQVIDIEQWLSRGALAAHRGDLFTARRIFRALARIAPYDQRVWIGLARVAATAAERAEALSRIGPSPRSPLPPSGERVIEPSHLSPILLRGEPNNQTTAMPLIGGTERRDSSPLNQLLNKAPVATSAGGEMALPPPLTSTRRHDQTQPRQRRLGWKLPAMLLLIAGGLLAVVMWQRQKLPLPPAHQLSTTNLPPTLATIGPLPTPLAGGTMVTPNVPTPSPLPPTSTPQPTSSPEPAMQPIGRLVTYDDWQFGLLRREDVVAIEQGIGDIKPTGTLWVALIAVSNNTLLERTLPATVFMLEDDAGQRYRPIAGASSRYLDLLGRSVYGDLALEDRFAPYSGLRSVPLLFDLPPERVPIRLWVGDEGWSLR